MMAPPTEASHDADGASIDAEVIDFSPLVIDLAGFSVSVNGHDIGLTLAEFLILVELARHPRQVRDRRALGAALREHGPPFHDSQPLPRGLDTHIARLRAKLRRAHCDCITTMRFVGYRFVPPGTEESPNEIQDRH